MAIIVDRRFLQKAEELWGSEHKIIPSFCSDKLAKPVNSHPDMTILPIQVFGCIVMLVIT